MTILARFAISGVIAAIASSLVSPEEAQGRVMHMIFFTLIGIGLLYDIVRLCLAYRNRQSRMIAKRQCPSCKSTEALEVTSDAWTTDPHGNKFRSVVLACINCDETYMIEATTKD